MNDSPRNLKLYKASAGSGKTFRLAVEYIALLVKNPEDYQHILAVTFTNKATAEMKQRILSQLFAIANGMESSKDYVEAIMKVLNEESFLLPNGKKVDESYIMEQCSMALSLIVHDYSNFHITTIDSFFQSIVKELAHELGLTTNISPEMHETNVIQKAVEEIIDNLSTTSPEYHSIVSYIESQIDGDKKWKIEEDIKNFCKNLITEKYLINNQSVRKYISNPANLYAFMNALEKHKVKQLEDFDKKMKKANDDAKKVIESNPLGNNLSSYAFTFVTTKKEKWERNHEEYLTDISKWAKPKSKNDKPTLDFVTSELMTYAQSLKDIVEETKCLCKDIEAAKAHLFDLMIIEKVSDKMSDINKEKNHFLIGETANFLHGVINDSNLPFIYEKTGTTYKHIMIDEFQDTSTLQWKNFLPLILDSLDQQQSCLIVGDVKQSIYRFRNSDWKILNNLDQPGSEVSCHILPIPNDTNFRSAPEVIDFNNKFFINGIDYIKEAYKEEHGVECDDIVKAYSDVVQNTKEKDNHFGYVRVENINFLKTIGDSTVLLPNEEEASKLSYDACEDVATDDDERDLLRIAQSIRDLLDNGVEENDITILVRTNKEAMAVCEYLEQHKDIINVKAVSDEAFKLESSSAVQLMIIALRSLSAQKDHLHLATLAYYYQTYVLGNQEVKDNPSTLLLSDEETLLTQFLPEKFGANRTDMRFKPISEIVENVYDMFSVSRLKDQDAYMFFFQDIVMSYCKDNLTDIDNFLTKWDEEFFKSTIPNGNAQGVRVMTIHKSKGLEFHSVIVPFCSFNMTPREPVLWSTPTQAPFSQMPLLPVDYKKITKSKVFAKEHDEEELLTLADCINVFYVAFTRAVNNLIIITKTKSDKPDKYNANKFICGALNRAFKHKEDKARMVPETFETESLTTYSFGCIVPHIKKKDQKKDKVINPLTRQYEPRSVAFVTSDTIAEFRQSNDSDLFISSLSEDSVAQSHAERLRLISIGNLYHNTLQNINTKDDIHTAINNMERRGCFERLADKDKVEKDVIELIDKVTVEHPEWYSPEWKTINERAIMFLDDKTLKPSNKRPDRVVVKDGKAIVIDYKTSLSAAEILPDGTVSVLHENKYQVMRYCKLLKELGYMEVEAYLWYILSDIIYKVN